MALSDNLRQFRQQKRLTLEEVAKSANVTRQSMHKYEEGQMIPNGIALVHIADKLGVTAEELVNGRTENKNLEN